MKIDRLTEQDIPSLAELFEQFRGEVSSIEMMRTIYARLADNPTYFLMAARQSDRLIGFAMGIICQELYGDCKPFMVIEDLIVDKSQRQNGIGSALMRELEKHAVDQNCCQIILVTESNRLDALRLYQSLGYEFEPYKGFKKRMGNG